MSSPQQQHREQHERSVRSVRSERVRADSPSRPPSAARSSSDWVRSESPSRPQSASRNHYDDGRRERDRERREKSIRERRSISPMEDDGSDGGGGEKRDCGQPRHRSKRPGASGDRTKQRRTRRTSVSGSGNNEIMAWSRPSKSPGPNRSVSHDVVSRHLQEKQRDAVDELVAQHLDVNFDKVRSSSNQSVGGSSVEAKKRSSKTAAIASSKDIDQVITQFREQCDVHMATLLELKNSITTAEKEVVVSSEKDKEFAQVRKWYSALAEKHTKLQKEHQALQEEHVKLQEKYMNLKRAGNFNESFHEFGGVDQEKKKEKKDKSLGDIVWSRAGKIRKNKHQQLQ